MVHLFRSVNHSIIDVLIGQSGSNYLRSEIVRLTPPFAIENTNYRYRFFR